MTNDGQPPPKKTRQSTSEEATPSPKTQSATSSGPKSPRMGTIPEMVVKPFDIEGSAYYNPELSLKDEKIPHSASSLPHSRSGPRKQKSEVDFYVRGYRGAVRKDSAEFMKMEPEYMNFGAQNQSVNLDISI
ncbi:hypothetical protein B9Z55_018595 [Caenorhabditis nigoni]|uniref:Uncharacterized protein n=1 Tax=Caenorhabditis nigoni TaxID=1611254 RepID=A0A2G5TEX3_9PELO|nr:hypothetical protein B9Z55_018595 [Caenorhabditis nigoni]